MRTRTPRLFGTFSSLQCYGRFGRRGERPTGSVTGRSQGQHRAGAGHAYSAPGVRHRLVGLPFNEGCPMVMLGWLILLLLGLGGSVKAQTSDFVTDDGIQGPLHQTHIGQVSFMADSIPLAKYTEQDMLKTYAMRPDGNLYMRVFLARSLTNYEHAMAPELDVPTLNRHGNFQISFLVDGKLVYGERLNWNSGGASLKNRSTIFRAPLLSVGHEDHWGVYVFRRFLGFGGAEALTPGTHVLRVEIRPWIDIPKIQTGDLIASGELTLEAPPYDKKPSAAEIAVQAIQPNSGWRVSKDRIDTALIRVMNEKIAQDVYKQITSIVVIKDGKLLLEEYFNGMGRDSLMDTRSVGKSFSSTLTGMAIRDKYVPDEQFALGNVYDLHRYDHYSPVKDSVRLKDLLTMSSAFDGSDENDQSPGNEENMYPTADWVKFALDLQMDSSKRNGGQWDYFTAGIVLIGDVLNRRLPGGLEKYAEAKLMGPLGITNYHWQYTPQHVPNTAGGIRLRALDLAKYGQLYKNNGQWNGKTILPPDWVAKTFTKYQTLPGFNGFPAREADEGYGYLFWNKHYTVGGRRYEVYYCSGNGGNKIFIFKDLPLVIVVTATAYNRPYAHPQVDHMMERYILPAVVR